MLKLLKAVFLKHPLLCLACFALFLLIIREMNHVPIKFRRFDGCLRCVLRGPNYLVLMTFNVMLTARWFQTYQIC